MIYPKVNYVNDSKVHKSFNYLRTDTDILCYDVKLTYYISVWLQ